MEQEERDLLDHQVRVASQKAVSRLSWIHGNLFEVTSHGNLDRRRTIAERSSQELAMLSQRLTQLSVVMDKYNSLLLEELFPSKEDEWKRDELIKEIKKAVE